jgi:hypothetical protein
MEEQTLVLIVSGKIVLDGSKIDWPDLNYPGSGQTILRTLYRIKYSNLSVQLDSEDGPWFQVYELPRGVGFFKKVHNLPDVVSFRK